MDARRVDLGDDDASTSTRLSPRVSSGFYSWCLTDYTLGVSQKAPARTEEGKYSVAIRSYHFLGQFRDSRNGKWHMFRTNTFERSPWQQQREMRHRERTICPPGAVRKDWLEGAGDQEEKDPAG